LNAVREGAEQAGRSLDDIDRFIEIKVSYDGDREYAKHACQFWAPLALTPGEKTGIDDATDMEAAAEKILDRAHTRFIVSDDPDEVIEAIAPYVQLGFEHLVFHGPGGDQERFLRQFCADVLPRLHDRFGGPNEAGATATGSLASSSGADLQYLMQTLCWMGGTAVWPRQVIAEQLGREDDAAFADDLVRAEREGLVVSDGDGLRLTDAGWALAGYDQPANA
jgi:hypothetical protein